jgi:Tol biopolymer transport system component
MKKSQITTLLVVLFLAVLSTVGCGVGSSTATAPVFTKMAFYSNRTVSPPTNLFLMNLDGSSVTPVPTSTGGLYTPSNSADLKTIAYTLSGFIWTSKADGSAQTQLTSIGYTYAVRLSPDGKKILFNQQDSVTNAYHIWIMNVDGTGPLDLTSTMPAGMTQCYGGSFSADSSKIAMNCQGNSSYGIYIIHPDGTGLTTVTNPNQYTDTPVFTPDSTKILFVLYGQPVGIFSINLDGTGQTSVAPNGYEAKILNSTLYYSAYDSTLNNNRIYKSNLDGTGAVSLTDGSSNDFVGTSTY